MNIFLPKLAPLFPKPYVPSWTFFHPKLDPFFPKCFPTPLSEGTELSTPHQMSPGTSSFTPGVFWHQAFWWDCFVSFCFQGLEWTLSLGSAALFGVIDILMKSGLNNTLLKESFVAVYGCKEQQVESVYGYSCWMSPSTPPQYRERCWGENAALPSCSPSDPKQSGSSPALWKQADRKGKHQGVERASALPSVVSSVTQPRVV